MRACFLGQNVCALGFGVATLQTPPLLDAEDTARPGPDDRHIPGPGQAALTLDETHPTAHSSTH